MKGTIAHRRNKYIYKKKKIRMIFVRLHFVHGGETADHNVGCVCYCYIHSVERCSKRKCIKRDMPINCMLCCMFLYIGLGLSVYKRRVNAIMQVHSICGCGYSIWFDIFIRRQFHSCKLNKLHINILLSSGDKDIFFEEVRACSFHVSFVHSLFYKSEITQSASTIE